ncbi:MAG TPA: fatty acid desaturase [Steroidobacteraceae bacterium]|nr:fatty acid desaturase [Steroidobacteraceae bacterium]
MSAELLYGLLDLPWWGYALVTFTIVQVMFLAITLFLHREQSHGGLTLHPALRHFFRFWLWFTSGTVTKEWVAVHRKHHAFADQDGDPHSPVKHGLKKVLFEGYELYVVASRDPEVLDRFGRGTPDDWMERNVYSRYSKSGLVLCGLLHIALFGVFSIIMFAAQLAAQPFFAAGVINGVGHAIGYRSFEMPAAARNIVPWGLLVGGEELHNNHHAFPRSARFSLQPWEFDMGWMWIRIFQAFGLATVRKVAPAPRIEAKRASLDADTLQALFTNRFHVLREYGRSVVAPVCRELARRDRGVKLPAGVRRLLVRHPELLGNEARRRLTEVLARHDVLRSVVEFRDSLYQLWNDTAANKARALTQLREWCARAEASGIQALRDFALSLRAYVPSPAAA